MPGFLIGVIVFVLLCSIRQIDEYERGILFQFGKYKKILNPGWRLVLPVIQSFSKVDIRTKITDMLFSYVNALLVAIVIIAIFGNLYEKIAKIRLAIEF